ncbi:MAG: hypothetical protein HRT64_00705, partial [Erythrobacter sp.]|nr:hypothetical protein [Erythrobacter sp.]
MIYSEESWIGPDIFGNVNPRPAHCQHIADYQRELGKRRERQLAARAERARIKRKADREWAALPDYLNPLAQAKADFAALPPERQAQL